MLKRSIVIASVGQRTAHRPHRMQRSSSLIIADSGKPAPSARSEWRQPGSAEVELTLDPAANLFVGPNLRGRLDYDRVDYVPCFGSFNPLTAVQRRGHTWNRR